MTPVLDELCLSLLFDLLHSLDGAHCEGSREGEQQGGAESGSREGEQRVGAEIARAAERGSRDSKGSREGQHRVGAESGSRS